MDELRHFCRTVGGQVFVGEDDELVEKSGVPVRRFCAEVLGAKTTDPGLASVDANELLVVKLLEFFKESFFSWADEWRCEPCGGLKCQSLGVTAASTQERSEGFASRTELYRCSSCGVVYRFPRYNNPKKLLETRLGRCGEWAIAFTYILHSLEIRARLVYANFDHVWVEFYNRTTHRWLHADPCENSLDNPLMYELGWRRPVTYALACGNDEIRDVTPRYTANWPMVSARRSQINPRFEQILDQFLVADNLELTRHMDHRERSRLTVNWMLDLSTMIHDQIDSKSFSERQSGSLAWRLKRAECSSTSATHQPVIIEVKRIENSQCWRMTYDCHLDRYTLDNGRTVDGFKSLANSVVNISRNVENDWKMCYLARQKHSQPHETGTIRWNFVNNLNLQCRRLEVRLNGDSFESGTMTLNLTVNNNSHKCTLTAKEKTTVEVTDSLKNIDNFSIEAILSGGDGQNSWQHAQLFRQSTRGVDNSHQPLFEIVVFFF